MTLTGWGVTLPMALCPRLLSKNGSRHHWSAVRRAKRDQQEFAIRTWQCEMPPEVRESIQPWPAAVMNVSWHYARGVYPDDEAVWARVCGVRDAFEQIGLVANDRHIRVGRVTCTRVPVGQESVTVTLRRDEEVGHAES